MDQFFKDLLDINEVHGVILRDFGGEVEYQNFRNSISFDPERLKPILDSLVQIQEADIIFANLRIYLRRSAAGHLLVVMARTVPIAMVRLHCDMIIPSLKPARKRSSKGFWGFKKS